MGVHLLATLSAQPFRSYHFQQASSQCYPYPRPLAHMRSCPNCTGHIMGDRPGRNCSTTYACSDGVSPPFNAALNAAFPGAWAARAGKTVLAGGTDAMHAGFYPGQANYIPFNASAYALSALLGSWLPPRGFDGIYLDGYGMLQLSDLAPLGSLDWDGDGVPESPQQALDQYNAWAPVFVARLRAELEARLGGREALIIANARRSGRRTRHVEPITPPAALRQTPCIHTHHPLSAGPAFMCSQAAGPMSDSNLNGLTIEMESCIPSRGGLSRCKDALEASRDVATAARRTPLSVLWLTHGERMSPHEQCAQVSEAHASDLPVSPCTSSCLTLPPCICLTSHVPWAACVASGGAYRGGAPMGTGGHRLLRRQLHRL